MCNVVSDSGPREGFYKIGLVELFLPVGSTLVKGFYKIRIVFWFLIQGKTFLFLATKPMHAKGSYT